MVYMFNELSLMKVNSRDMACELLEKFIKSHIEAKKIGFDEIRLHKNSFLTMYSIPLCDNYNIDLWLRDSRVNTDLQDRFREIVTSSPLITEGEITQNDFFARSEFSKILNGKSYQVWGLGAAYIYGTLAISIATHSEWEKSEIMISHYYLNEHASELTEDVSVRHFSSIKSFQDNLQWWEECQSKSLRSSEELWDKKDEFFPNLEFCSEIKKQLKSIGVSKTLFQIVERLKTLDKYVKNWETGNFSYEDVNHKTNLRISPESESTLRKFGSLRKFFISGLGKVIFDLHIKTGDLRIHLYPDSKNRKIYIGYIGKHLRISSED